MPPPWLLLSFPQTLFLFLLMVFCSYKYLFFFPPVEIVHSLTHRRTLVLVVAMRDRCSSENSGGNVAAAAPTETDVRESVPYDARESHLQNIK